MYSITKLVIVSEYIIIIVAIVYFKTMVSIRFSYNFLSHETTIALERIFNLCVDLHCLEAFQIE